MKTNFRQRMDTALPHEKQVRQWLEAAGWTVQLCGTGFFPDAFRRGRSNFRWWPELGAYKGERGCFVDAKSGVTNTPNYAIENAALETYEMIEKYCKTRVFAVFPERRVLGIAEIRANCGPVRNGIGTNGSGTPYVLVPKLVAKPFEKIFGSGESIPSMIAHWNDLAIAFAGTPFGDLCRRKSAELWGGEQGREPSP